MNDRKQTAERKDEDESKIPGGKGGKIAAGAAAGAATGGAMGAVGGPPGAAAGAAAGAVLGGVVGAAQGDIDKERETGEGPAAQPEPRTPTGFDNDPREKHNR